MALKLRTLISGQRPLCLTLLNPLNLQTLNSKIINPKQHQLCLTLLNPLNLQTLNSNYSAWHYRSSFMEQDALKGQDVGGGGGGRESLLEALEVEAELVQGAVFTDPEDQSAWLYLR